MWRYPMNRAVLFTVRQLAYAAFVYAGYDLARSGNSPDALARFGCLLAFAWLMLRVSVHLRRMLVALGWARPRAVAGGRRRPWPEDSAE